MAEVEKFMTKQRASDGREFWVEKANLDAFLESQKVEGDEREKGASVAGFESTNGFDAAMSPPPPQYNSDELVALMVENITLRVSHEKDEDIISLLERKFSLLENKNSLLEDKVALLERTLASLERGGRGGEGGDAEQRSDEDRDLMTRQRLSSFNNMSGGERGGGRGGGRGRGGRGKGGTRLSNNDLEAAASSFGKLQESKESLPKGWATKQDDEGNVYYWNETEGLSQWEKP